MFEKEITSDNGTFVAYNVSAKRTYKDGDSYKSTQGFRGDDIPHLIQLLTQASAFIMEEMNRE